MTKQLYSFRVHRPRPVFEALDRAAIALHLDYVGGVLSVIADCGIRGLIVMERRAVRSRGWRAYLRDTAGWLRDDLSTSAAALVAQAIGARGARWLIAGVMDSRISMEANTGLFEASEALRKQTDPAYAAQVAQWAADRQRLETERADTLAVKLASEPPSLFMLMLDLWDAMDTDAQREHFLLQATEALPFVGFNVGDFDHQVWHASGNHEALINTLCDKYVTPEERRDTIEGWRARGLGYLADFYAPLAAERLGLTASDTMSEAA